MADASSFDANVITTAVDSAGNIAISVTQVNTTRASIADTTVVTTGVAGSVSLDTTTRVEATTITGGKGDKGDTGAQGPAGTYRKTYRTPVEVPNGVRMQFTAPGIFVLTSLSVHLNGILEHYITEDSTTQFTFSTAPLSTDIIDLEYNTA